jgi:integrase
MTTKDQYINSLKSLDKFNIDYKKIYTKSTLKKVLETIKKIPNQRSTLSKETISIPTIKKYILSIIYYYKSINKYSDNMKKMFKPVIDNFNNVLRNKIEENKLQGNQKKNYIEWEDVIEIYKKLEKTEYDRSLKSYVDFVLLSLYVLFPPRRSKDYAIMKIGKPKGKSFNYYWNGKFYFNNYKTSKDIGNQIFDVPTNLVNIINDFIKKYKVTGLLLKKNIQGIYSKLASLLGKQASVNILRHSYISYVLNNNKLSIKDKREIANKMAHSITTQAEYVKI